MPKQARTPNKHGCLPPLGCTLPTHPEHPQVATGNEGKASYEAAFLVETDELYEAFSATVVSCATLKAWFAYRLRAQAIRDGLSEQNAMLDLQLKLPVWQAVWDLIREKRAVWTEQYEKRGSQTNPWELQSPWSPISALDLFAHVLVVLALNITANTDAAQAHSSGLRWHQYYYEEEGRFFLLYRFMTYLNTIITSGRAMSIYEPSDPSKRRSWVGSYGYRIHKAAKSYMKDVGWDPIDMLGKSLESGALERPSGLDANKVVAFIYHGKRKRHFFKVDVKTIRQHAGANLRRTLRELFGIGKVVTRAVQNDKQIQSLNELWTSIKSSKSPIFWMSHESDDHKTSTPAPAQQTSQRDFSNHSILKLESLVAELDNQDQARSAQSRFNLIRENHRHSAEFVKELMESFAPLETATTRRWQMISDCKRICDDAAKDNTQFYKLRHMIADLSDTRQAHAQQYFTLVNTNNPLASVAAENLIKLFTPDEAEAKEVSKMKGIFDEIKRDTTESGGATA